MAHHTHDKGDNALAEVITDLTKHGYKVCLPISSHLPFDLIAVSNDGRLCKLQVKYRTIEYNGTINIELSTSAVNARRTRRRSMLIDRKWVDAWAVFCPNTSEIYYVRTDELDKNQKCATLRVALSKNNQIAKVKFASEYKGADRLFSP